MATTKDNVNHPTHYETGKFECIDVMIETQGEEAVKDFCICNAFKYLYRHKNKNGIEDIKKARWYLDKYIEISERDSESELSIEISADTSNFLSSLAEAIKSAFDIKKIIRGRNTNDTN